MSQPDRHRTICALALVALLVPASALAQTPQDTLDWHRYYPLAVGNLWEYHEETSHFENTRYHLVADTTVGGRQYFEREISYQNRPVFGDVVFTSTDFVRYDTSGFVVSVASPSSDSPPVDPCSDDDYFERDLRLGFGARVDCPTSSGDSLFVEGAYDEIWTAPGGAPVSVAAIKTFFLGGLIYSAFVADVGPTGAGNLWGPRLHYARIGGVEYGTPLIVVAVEPSAPTASDLDVRVLGNPVRDRADFEIHSVTTTQASAELFDAVGRRLWSTALLLPPGLSRFDVPADQLGSGTYLLRVSLHDGSMASRRFTVVR